MSAPEQVKVGHQTYQIIYRKRSEDGMLSDGNYGYILDDSNSIIIDADSPINKQQTTLWHEIFHAARMVFDTGARPAAEAEFEDTEHYFIGLWEAPLLIVIKDNPELVLWLTKENEWKQKITKVV